MKVVDGFMTTLALACSQKTGPTTMCDMVMAAIGIDQRVSDKGRVVAEIRRLVERAGMGAHFAPRWPENRVTYRLTKHGRRFRSYRTVLTSRLASALSDDWGTVIMFELTASTKDACICNATWNNSSPPVPNPERAPIVTFLQTLLSMPTVTAAAFFYGPVDYTYAQAVAGSDLVKESRTEFVERFYTEAPDRVIGNQASGLFYVRVGIAPA